MTSTLLYSRINPVPQKKMTMRHILYLDGFFFCQKKALKIPC
ncbi:hypothetical protein EMIT051CA3_40537 [Pseudomonas chlororaphis]